MKKKLIMAYQQFLCRTSAGFSLLTALTTFPGHHILLSNGDSYLIFQESLQRETSFDQKALWAIVLS